MVGAVCFAQVGPAPAPSAPREMGAGPGAMPGPAVMPPAMGVCPMHAAMMWGVAGRASVVAADGAIHMLAGDQLLKYDSNLSLQHRTDIKMDWSKVGRMARQWMQGCPMCLAAPPGAPMIPQPPMQEQK